MVTSVSVDEKEIQKFTAMADEWWDESGKFKPLHKFNPVRVSYIQNVIEQHFGLNKKKSYDPSLPLKNIRILDVGCGGGLMSESLAALGAKVLGIDAGEKNVKIAATHAKKTGVTVEYSYSSVEELVEKNTKPFDVVLNLEVLEHVSDVHSFIQSSATLVKPGGLQFMATINRTPKAYALAIIGAEYILRWLPRGTHEWSKFLKPSEIAEHLRGSDMEVQEVKGMTYNPLLDAWSLSNDTAVNYLMWASKS